MKCIIVDDEATARVILKQLCYEIKSITVVAEFENAIEAIKYLNTHPVDLVLLDIHLPHLNGLEFVQTLKNPPQIILISSDKSYALDAYEYNCVLDYLLKPVSLKRLKKATDKVSKTLLESSTGQIQKKETFSNDLYINIGKKLIKIDMSSILLVESKGDYISLKTHENNYVIHSTLKKIHKKLPESIFLKIHRSYIINISKISTIEDNTVIINKEIIPISRSSRPELIGKLNLL